MATTQGDREFLDFGDFSMDRADGTLTHLGQRIHLSPICSHILLKFLESPGTLITKEEFKKSCWSVSRVLDGSFYQRMAEVYKCLENGASASAFVENRPGRGYRFIAKVTVRYVPAPVPETPPAAGPELHEESGIGNDSESRPLGDTPAPRRDGRSPGLRWLPAILSITIGALVADVFVVWNIANLFSTPRIEEYPQITSTKDLKTPPLLREGGRLYLNIYKGVDQKLAYLSTAGPDLIELQPPERATGLFAVNQRTGQLLLGSSDGLWLWTPGNSWARKLPLPAINSAAFSPDGGVLVIGTGGSPAKIALYSAANLNQPLWQLPLGPNSVPDAVAFTPDARSVRSTIFDTRMGQSSIWECSLDGEGLRRILPDPRNSDGSPPSASEGAWTGDGRWFIFSSMSNDDLDNRGDLWAVREPPAWLAWLGRPSPHKLISPMHFNSPVIGPDGKTIYAIGSDRSVVATRFDVQTREFQPFLDGAAAADLDSSRDGQWIAYTDDWKHTIWKSRPDGSGRAQLTFAPLEAWQPHWSPDGQRIAFMGRAPGGHWRAYVIPAEGGQPAAFYEDRNEQGVPTWSPDGLRVVWGDRNWQRPRSQMAIHVFDLRTHTLSDLPGSAGRWSARWSPDGRYIAAQTADFKEVDLFDVSRQTWECVVTSHGTDDLNWSPDSAFLYFAMRKSRQYTCDRVRIASRKVEQILRREDYPDLDTHLLGVAPDNSPVFARVVAREQIYSIKVNWP